MKVRKQQQTNEKESRDCLGAGILKCVSACCGMSLGLYMREVLEF